MYATTATHTPRKLPAVIHMAGRDSMTAEELAKIITCNFALDVDPATAYRMHCQLFGVHLAMTVAHNFDAADYFQRLAVQYWQLHKA
jgi:hypothetical protein